MNSCPTAKPIQMWTELEFWLKSKDNSDVNWTWLLAEYQRQFRCKLNMNSGSNAKAIQMYNVRKFWPYSKTNSMLTEHEFWPYSKTNSNVNWTWIPAEKNKNISDVISKWILAQRHRQFRWELHIHSSWTKKTIQMWTELDFWLNSKYNSDVNWAWLLAEQKRQFRCKLNINSGSNAKAIYMYNVHEFWSCSKANSNVNWTWITAE